MPIAPNASHELAWLMIALSLIAVVYIGLVALMQSDMKKLVAYSSISHMGFVTLGFFIFNAYGIEGGLLQMISHGFVSGALFLGIGVLYERVHSRQIADYGGVAHKMPVFAAFFVLFAMANSGLPGTSGFIGEFLVMVGVFKDNTLVALLIATGVILGAAYMLWLYRRVIFGELVKEDLKSMLDLSLREKAIFAPLLILVFWMGLYPLSFTSIFGPTVTDFIQNYGPRMEAVAADTAGTNQ